MGTPQIQDTPGVFGYPPEPDTRNPSPSSSDAGKVVTVNDDGTGFELTTPSGASAPPLQASAHVMATPFAGGYQGTCVLQEDTLTNRQWNIICCTLPPWAYEAGHIFMLEVDAPEFSAGALSISYAEMDVTNVAGTQRISVGRDAPQALTTGQQIAPLIWDDDAEVEAVGSDLAMGASNGHVTTTAGGVFVVSFFVQFRPVGLVA